MKKALMAAFAAMAACRALHAAGIEPFPEGARVAFFGDSLTAGGGVVLRIAAHYRTEFPERDVRFYNCGISGGRLETADMYFDAVLASRRPTHVVFAFGLNDALEMYNRRVEDPEAEAKRTVRELEDFRRHYARAIGRLETLGPEIILRIPTPYNEFGPGDAPADAGKNEVVRRFGDEIRAFAREKGLPILDDYARMSKFLADGEDVYIGDRIHPNDFGQWRMAETLLSAQGLVIAPYRTRAEAASAAGLSKWDGLMQRQSDINAFEWQGIRDESIGRDEKIAKAKKWLETNGCRPGVHPFTLRVAKAYVEDKPREDAIRADTEAAWDASCRGWWFDRARYGVFIHYGAYSVAARGEWVKNREKLSNGEYTELYAKNFKAGKLDCAAWARKFRAWGFGYAVLTARHHDGYAMWNSKVNPYNCVNIGGAPDVVGEYVGAMRAEGLKVGLYYSPASWSHPDYPGPFFRDWPGEKDWKSEEARRRFIAWYRAELKELLDGYGPIDYLWFDGCIPENIDGGETLAWLRRDYPAMMVNNRLADGYDVKVCEQTINPPKDGSVRWEACMTLNGNWGWHAGDTMWKTPVQVIDLLGRCAAKGGNLLLNVGPKADGTIPLESEEILGAVGEWLAQNKTAYTSTVRNPFTWNNTGSPITVKGDKIYITFLRDPKGSFRWAELANACLSAKWVDDGTPVEFEQRDGLLFLKNLVWRAPGRIVELTVAGCPQTLSPQTTFWIPE